MNTETSLYPGAALYQKLGFVWESADLKGMEQLTLLGTSCSMLALHTPLKIHTGKVFFTRIQRSYKCTAPFVPKKTYPRKATTDFPCFEKADWEAIFCLVTQNYHIMLKTAGQKSLLI